MGLPKSAQGVQMAPGTYYWASGTDGIGNILIIGMRPSFYHLGIQDDDWQWVFCDDHRCD
jgi:hypothetical protein